MAFHTEDLHKKTKNSYFSFFLLNWRLANLDYDLMMTTKLSKWFCRNTLIMSINFGEIVAHVCIVLRP